MMPVIIDTRVPRHTGLNRTFYGIETTAALIRKQELRVLIVPFMELKLSLNILSAIICYCLNRTIKTSIQSFRKLHDVSFNSIKGTIKT